MYPTAVLLYSTWYTALLLLYFFLLFCCVCYHCTQLHCHVHDVPSFATPEASLLPLHSCFLPTSAPLHEFLRSAVGGRYIYIYIRTCARLIQPSLSLCAIAAVLVIWRPPGLSYSSEGRGSRAIGVRAMKHWFKGRSGGLARLY